MKKESYLLLLSLIEEVVFNGGENNFVIIGLNDYYIQLAGSKGAHEVRCEAVSNYYLDAEYLLNESQMNKLLEYNWLDRSTENYKIIHPVDSEENRNALVELIFKTANEVYNVLDISAENIDLHLE